MLSCIHVTVSQSLTFAPGSPQDLRVLNSRSKVRPQPTSMEKNPEGLPSIYSSMACLLKGLSFLGCEVDLVLRRVVFAVRRLLASAGSGRASATRAGRAGGLRILDHCSVAVAFAGRSRTAGAPRSGDGVLGRSLLAGAVKGGLLATGASSLFSWFPAVSWLDYTADLEKLDR